jgi:hypothetical protein
MGRHAPLVVGEFGDEHSCLQLPVELVAHGRDGEACGPLDVQLLGSVTSVRVLVYGHVGSFAAREQGPEHLHELVRGLRFVRVDPDVLQYRRVFLSTVEEALGARALEG